MTVPYIAMISMRPLRINYIEQNKKFWNWFIEFMIFYIDIYNMDAVRISYTRNDK